MTIVTGRHPHVLAQLWWRLVDAERDGAAIKALCSGIGLALGGDSTVSNPSRVLRLGGSIAWPVKPGRIRETTEVHIPEDGRPPDYWAATLAKSFAAPAPLLNAAPKSPEQSAPPSTPASAAPKPLDLPIGSLSVEATLAAIQRNDRWHQNAVRLVGNWVARGLSDAEILSFAPALTIGRAADGRSYTPDQTRQQLASMIIGARRKWNVPNPQIAIDDKLTIPPLDIEWEDGAHTAMIPRRRWLVGSFAIRGHLTVLVAPPGAGKSTLGIALAVAGITGRWPRSSAKPFTRPSRRGSGTMKTTATNCAAALARDHAAMERRARRSALAKLGLDSGSERPLVIAKATKDGAVVRLPDIEAIIERVQAEGIGLLIVDPFVETHEVDENNNAQIKAVAAMWREVAQAAAIAGLGAAFYGVCNAAVRFPGDALRARFGDVPLMIASLLVAIAGFAGLGFTESFAASVAAFAMVGLGTAVLIPCTFAMAAAFVPENRPGALSFMSLLTIVPRTLSPWLFGLAAAGLGIGAAFGLVAVAFGVALVLLVVLSRVGKRK